MDLVESLSASQSLRLLAGRSLGRVAYTERALPAIRPLPYALVGTHVVLRTRNEQLARRLDGQVVAFQVDDADGNEECSWSVVVTGTARILREPSELLRLGSAVPLVAWSGPEQTSAVQITPGEVRGRRVLLDPADAPLSLLGERHLPHHSGALTRR